ncbi:glycosyltransferase, partial [Acinetobacter baumannii]
FSDCYRPRINGVVTSLISLKTGLEKLGHRVTLIAPSYPNQDDTEPGIVRLKAFSFPTWPEDRAALPLPLSAMRALRSADFDVVHIH